MKIVGYADKLSARPGERVQVSVSCSTREYRPTIVRVLQPGSDRHHLPLLEEDVDSALPVSVPGRVQSTSCGSFLRAVIKVRLDEFSAALWFKPSVLSDDPRPLLALGGLTVEVSSAGLFLLLDGRPVVHLRIGLGLDVWAMAMVSVAVDGQVRLRVYRPDYPMTELTTRLVQRWRPADDSFLLGRSGIDAPAVARTFNGRLARPVLYAGIWECQVADALFAGADPLTLLERSRTSALDLGRDIAGSVAPDRGGLTGGAEIRQLPARGIPGPFWAGTTTDPKGAPDQFDGIHLHDDDVIDAGWAPDFSWTIPTGLSSGVYAIKLTTGTETDRIPIVVTPATPSASVLVVLPTWTYLSYALWRTYAEFEDDRALRWGERRSPDDRDRWLMDHPEFGKSHYDDHSDGSGVMYVSALRPLITLRPDYYCPTTRGYRHFGQDLLLLRWLELLGVPYDVVTDDEIDRRGDDLLSSYRVVLTGAHPEYCSGAMLDAYLEYTKSGGRLMYLGGNGFYWVTAAHPAHPYALEIRRGHAGETRWYSAPGEEYLAATGEIGGLWRNRGRAPNTLTGVGFTAFGTDRADGYRRTARSAEPDVAWVFESVSAGAGQAFGTEGPGLGGAAGDELDRADVTLGTPVEAAVLASSFGHSELMFLVPEEKYLGYRAPLTEPDPKIRADLVLLSRPNGGAVFSTGSITWSTAMTHNDFSNDVATITANVLRRFLDPAPLSIGND